MEEPVKISSSKLAAVKCDCGRCDCMICSEEIMKRREAARLARKHPDDCICMPGCDCAKCADGIAAKQKHKSSMECCDLSNPHPPDCDCVDCLCEPCGSFPAEGDTPRPHPPDCDCFHCLCEPCGDMEDGCDMNHYPSKPESKTLTEVLRCSREASCRELLRDKMPEHPPGCNCIVCRCCEGSGKIKGEENQDGDAKVQIPRKFPPKICTCVECRCLIESPPIIIQQISIIQTDLSNTTQESRIPEKRTDENAHIPECDCIDCLLFCDTACPDPTVAPAGVLPDIDSAFLKQCGKPQSEKKEEVPENEGVEPEEAGKESTESIQTESAEVEIAAEEISKERTESIQTESAKVELDAEEVSKEGTEAIQTESAKMELDAEEVSKKGTESMPTETTEVVIEAESLERTKEINELQDLIKQIQCACYEAELQAAKSLPLPNAFVVHQTPSYEDTLSGLHLALSSLQDKCNQKDRMIAAMTKELKVRANSKVFNDMLQRINQSRLDDKEIVVDFDRKEVCDSLPRPICDPKYGKPSNQLREPLVCQPCEHSNYPNCPCSIIQQIPECSHPNYPNCPCKKVDDEPSFVSPDPLKSIPSKSSSVHSKHTHVSCQCSRTECKPTAEKPSEPKDNDKEIPGETAEDEQPAQESKSDSSEYPRPDYPDYPCKETTIEPPSSSSLRPKPICGHPDFPICPCVPGSSKSQPEKSQFEKPVATEQDVSSGHKTEQNEFPVNIPDEPLEKKDEAPEKNSVSKGNVKMKPARQTELPPCLHPRKPTCVCKPSTKSADSMPAQESVFSGADRTKKPQKPQRKCVSKDKNKNLSHKHCSLPNATKKSRSRAHSPACVCHTHSNISGPPFAILKDEEKASTSSQKPPGRKSSSKCDKSNKEQEVILKESILNDSDSFKTSPDCSCPDEKNSRPTPAGKQSASDTPLRTTVKIKISPLAASSPDLCSCNPLELQNDSSYKLQPPSGKIISSAPMEVTDIRRISPDSLLIKWKAPTSEYVIGYEILVDGVIRSRVRSPDRTSAVLHTLNIKDDVNIMIYAITAIGRCQPPAIAIYQL